MASLDERKAVEELVYRTCLALDAKDWNGFLELCDPAFRYTITADVTDTTGETRTGSKSVQVGYVALRATITAEARVAASWADFDSNDFA